MSDPILFGEPVIALDALKDQRIEQRSLESQIAKLEKEARRCERRYIRYSLLASEAVYKAVTTIGATVAIGASSGLVAHVSTGNPLYAGIAAGIAGVCALIGVGITVSDTSSFALDIREIYLRRRNDAMRRCSEVLRKAELLKQQCFSHSAPPECGVRDQAYLVSSSADAAAIAKLVRDDAAGGVQVFYSGLAGDARHAANIASGVCGKAYGGIVSQADATKLLVTLAKDTTKQNAVVILHPHAFEALTGSPCAGDIVKLVYEPMRRAWYRGTFG